MTDWIAFLGLPTALSSWLIFALCIFLAWLLVEIIDLVEAQATVKICAVHLCRLRTKPAKAHNPKSRYHDFDYCPVGRHWIEKGLSKGKIYETSTGFK